jgi:uncharacterized protein YutE (UPF0331/DUF86 family)
MPDISNAYIVAQRQHLDDCEIDLQNLAEVLEHRAWTRIERSATERTLQLLIESCIGIAKHRARQLTGKPCKNVMSAFEHLSDAGLVKPAIPWRKIVGLRNVLVHDYLDVDEQIVQDVIANGHYHSLLDFARNALAALEKA